jgi:hypothetical protein
VDKTPFQFRIVKLFFYFKNNDTTMQSYYNQKKKIKSYWYVIQNAANLVFKVVKNDENFNVRKIKARDTIG